VISKPEKDHPEIKSQLIAGAWKEVSVCVEDIFFCKKSGGIIERNRGKAKENSVDIHFVLSLPTGALQGLLILSIAIHHEASSLPPIA
jgi:hypothetical protein